MTVTIGLVANIYNECNALPGWLEVHTPFFDDIRVLHSGPGGCMSDDGTLDILRKWGIPVAVCSIDAGFGEVRTRAIHSSPCDWVMLLDADERFYPTHRVLTCGGDATPQAEVDRILQTYDFSPGKSPDWNLIGQLGAGLHVDVGPAYDQGLRLRELLGGFGDYDAIACVRRHWHDLSFRRPTQNWHSDLDWQMRLVRNDSAIYFDSGTRMHERLVGAKNVFRADMTRGPFYDHFHFTFKRMEVEQRRHDVEIYNSINDGRRPPTWSEFKS